MKFRLQRQEIDENLSIFCINKIKQHKVNVPKAGKKAIQGMPAILKEIQKSGLPKHLLIKKLKGKIGHGVFLHPEAKRRLKG